MSRRKGQHRGRPGDVEPRGLSDLRRAAGRQRYAAIAYDALTRYRLDWIEAVGEDFGEDPDVGARVLDGGAWVWDEMWMRVESKPRGFRGQVLSKWPRSLYNLAFLLHEVGHIARPSGGQSPAWARPAWDAVRERRAWLFARATFRKSGLSWVAFARARFRKWGVARHLSLQITDEMIGEMIIFEGVQSSLALYAERESLRESGKRDEARPTG